MEKSNEKSILKTLDSCRLDFIKNFGVDPREYRTSEKTLDEIIEEIKKNFPWFIKSKEQMKEEGFFYLGAIFIIDDSIEYEKIIVK